MGWNIFHMDWIEIKYEINSNFFFIKYLYIWKKTWIIRMRNVQDTGLKFFFGQIQLSHNKIIGIYGFIWSMYLYIFTHVSDIFICI
jgi:hypothetical protein